MADDKELSLPGSSWDTVKRIVRAFHAAGKEDSSTVKTIAKYAGVPRPVVSMNNNFLRSVGLVRPDAWKLTELGTRYATGLEMNNDSMATESLSDAVRANTVLQGVLNTLRARGELKADTLRGEFLIRMNISPNDRRARFVKPLFDMLQEAGLIEIAGDSVTLANMQSPARGEKPRPLPGEARAGNGVEYTNFDARNRQPILLGPGRLAYIELPSDWEKKDLPKLLKLLEISLGEET